MTMYPALCNFPGCENAAPLAEDGDVSLCIEHARMRFYEPDTYARLWQERDPDP